MATKSRKETHLRVIPGKAKSNVEDDLDDLFKLPLTEFIDARKTLAARLKKEGRATDADDVKALVKPSVSAWAVNQLYWRHREPFDRLIATGQEVRRAQKAGKVADMREALDARREVLSQLSDHATDLLRDAGNNPSLDMIRRIATTLEGMSAYASLPDGMSVGRLTKDIDPPGFDSLAAFTTAAPMAAKRSEPTRPSKPAVAVKPPPKSKPAAATNQLKEMRQTKLAAAKAALQDAKKSLVAARVKTQSLGTGLKKADAEAKQAEKQKREAEQRFKAASTASAEAAVRVQRITAELERSTKAIDDAQRTVEKAATELESAFKEK